MFAAQASLNDDFVVCEMFAVSIVVKVFDSAVRAVEIILARARESDVRVIVCPLSQDRVMTTPKRQAPRGS